MAKCLLPCLLTLMLIGESAAQPPDRKEVAEATFKILDRFVQSAATTSRLTAEFNWGQMSIRRQSPFLLSPTARSGYAMRA